MIELLLVVILVLYLAGMISGTTLGGAIHVLLIVFLVLVILRFAGPWRRDRLGP